MLEHIEKHELNSIMTWQVHGRCFLIHDKERLEEELLHLFFGTKKYQTLRRNLNNWGFKQIQGIENPDKGCYYHPMFLRTQYKLCASMTRTSLVSSDKESGELPFQEPKFHTMPPLPPSSLQEQEGSSASETNFLEEDFVRSCDSSKTVSSSDSKMNISCHQFSGHIWQPNTYCATATQVNHDNLQPSDALANEENIGIDFDTQTLQKLKTLLPDDPRALCDVFDCDK